MLGPQDVVHQVVGWCRNTLEGVDKGIEIKGGIRQQEKERYSRQVGTRTKTWQQLMAYISGQDGSGCSGQGGNGFLESKS